MTEFDPAEHRMVSEQRWFEDFVLGERFVIPSRTMTAAVFAAFQPASRDTHPVHYDVEYCRARGMPNLLAHGFQTLIHTAPGAGLFPFMLEESLVGFLEQSSRFLKSVYADDTIYPALEVTELVPGRSTGVVTLRSTVFNQRRELVLEAATARIAASFDHLVGDRKQVRRYLDSKRLGGLEVDHQLEFGRLHYRHLGRVGSFENLAAIDSGLAIHAADTRTIADQAAAERILPFEMDRRDALLRGERGYRIALTEQHRICRDKDRIRTFANKGLERHLEIILAPHVEHERLLSENPDRLLGIPLFGCGARIVRIHEQCHPGSWGELIEDFDALGADLAGDGADPRHIAARTIVAGDETDLDRISSDGEHDRNPRRGSQRGAGGSDVAGGADHGDFEVGQFRRKRREPTVIALGPAIFDPDILAFDETDVLKTLPKRRRVEIVQFE